MACRIARDDRECGHPDPRRNGPGECRRICRPRHALDIRFVIAAAAAGAIVGDKIGFWVGREFGEPSLALAVVIGFVLWRYYKKHEEILCGTGSKDGGTLSRRNDMLLWHDFRPPDSAGAA
jgi:hypothetical protein